LFVSEKTSLSSVSDSRLYILQYSGQAELRRLTLAHERQAGLKAAYARAKEAEIHPAAEGVARPHISADMH
jgi:hypothetical protein